MSLTLGFILLLGTIWDANHGAIPAAQLTITNQDTGIVWRIQTDAQGYYIAPSLNPGIYRIVVETPGFERSVSVGNVINIAQDTRVDFTMKVGAVTESVEVTAAAPLVRSTTSEIGTVVTEHEVENLPLNGRLFSQLVQLTPGSIDDGWGDEPETPSGAGARSPIMSRTNGVPYAGGSFTLDGVNNKETMNSFISLSPPVEAIQEFKVQTSNPTAEFGTFGGAIVNLTIKSGTNQLKGSLFEYFRNNALNARRWEAATRPVLQSNQFGGTVGGPIVRNKAFFFFDYQGLRLNYPAVTFLSVPSNLMRQGIFTSAEGFGTQYDPDNNHAPFPNNQIPVSRWNPVAAKTIAGTTSIPGGVFPLTNQLPTSVGSNGPSQNYQQNVGPAQDARQFDIKVDYQFSEKSRAFVRESYSFRNYISPSPGTIFMSPANPNSESRNHNAVIGHTYVFTPELLNEFRLGLNRFNTSHYGNDSAIQANNELGILNGNLPQDLQTYGIASLGIAGMSNTGNAAWSPGHRINTQYQLTEGITWMKRKHVLKAGGNLILARPSLTNPAVNPRGALSFSSNYTSAGLSSGNNGGSGWASFLLGYPASVSRGFVTTQPMIRMNFLGVYLQDDYRVNEKLTVNIGLRWDFIGVPTEKHYRQSNLVLEKGVMLEASPDNPVPNINNFMGSLAPRVGVAYSPDRGKTAVRAAFGLTYFSDQSGGSGGTLVFNYPMGQQFSLTSPTNYTPFFNINTTGLPVPVSYQLGVGATFALPANIVPYYMPSSWRPDEVAMWNFGIERKLHTNGSLEISYVGTRGFHLWRARNINSPLINNGTNRDLYRPLLAIMGTRDVTQRNSDGDSSYNSLQAKYQRRFHNGLFGLVSYTFSKNIDDLSIWYVWNDALNRGPSNRDTPHNFVASYGYELPFGKGKRFMSNPNRWLQGVAGGWVLNGITKVRTGFPLTIYSNSNLVNALSSNQANYSSTCSDGVIPIYKSVSKWFETGCFASVTTVNVLGNTPRGVIRGPGMINWDLSASKAFRFLEKRSVEFRSDFFNATNSPHFSNPGNTVGVASFGKITATSLPAREIQVSLKLLF